MESAEARFLVSAAGERLLAAAIATRGLAPHVRPGALRGQGTPEQVRAALRQDDLRVRAAAKLPHADRLWFTPEALEQATPWAVAAERAARWPGPGHLPLHDLTAGIGIDALAAACAGRRVVAHERDEARAILLARNAAALGVEGRLAVEVRDVTGAPPRGDLAFLDPDRRPGGRRTRDPERFEPPASSWPSLLAGFPCAMVKVPPSGAAEGRPAGPREVVSLDHRAREARLFLGAWGPLPPRRALALPRGGAVEGEGVAWPPPQDLAPGAWLLDPDPAVTLAGLVGDLARRDGLAPVHPRIAYLVGATPSPAAPGTWMRVDAVCPARAAEVDRWLSTQGVGRLTIRTRGVEDDAAAWRRRLHPRGPRAGTVAFLRDARERWVAAFSLDASPGGPSAA